MTATGREGWIPFDGTCPRCERCVRRRFPPTSQFTSAESSRVECAKCGRPVLVTKDVSGGVGENTDAPTMR